MTARIRGPHAAADATYGMPLIRADLIEDGHQFSRRRPATALFTWIEGWYNPQRRHYARGDLSPIAFEPQQENASNPIPSVA